MRQKHIAPLARKVIAILHEIEALTGMGCYVFPNLREPSEPNDFWVSDAGKGGDLDLGQYAGLVGGGVPLPLSSHDGKAENLTAGLQRAVGG